MTVIVESLDDFNLDTLKRVAWDGEPVVFGSWALARMRTAREQFLGLLDNEPDLHVYGVTTGFDDAAGTIVGPQERAYLATRPVDLLGAGVGGCYRSGSCGRWCSTRLINYVSGYTGLSLETAQQVADMLDGRPLPVVRLQGQDSQGELLGSSTSTGGSITGASKLATTMRSRTAAAAPRADRRCGASGPATHRDHGELRPLHRRRLHGARPVRPALKEMMGDQH